MCFHALNASERKEGSFKVKSINTNDNYNEQLNDQLNDVVWLFKKLDNELQKKRLEFETMKNAHIL